MDAAVAGFLQPLHGSHAGFAPWRLAAGIPMPGLESRAPFRRRRGGHDQETP